jgi:hypothetical protein
MSRVLESYCLHPAFIKTNAGANLAVGSQPTNHVLNVAGITWLYGSKYAVVEEPRGGGIKTFDLSPDTGTITNKVRALCLLNKLSSIAGRHIPMTQP